MKMGGSELSLLVNDIGLHCRKASMDVCIQTVVFNDSIYDAQQRPFY